MSILEYRVGCLECGNTDCARKMLVVVDSTAVSSRDMIIDVLEDRNETKPCPFCGSSLLDYWDVAVDSSPIALDQVLEERFEVHIQVDKGDSTVSGRLRGDISNTAVFESAIGHIRALIEQEFRGLPENSTPDSEALGVLSPGLLVQLAFRYDTGQYNDVLIAYCELTKSELLQHLETFSVDIRRQVVAKIETDYGRFKGQPSLFHRKLRDLGQL